MTRTTTPTRVLAGLLAGLTLAGVGTAATALGSDDPAAAAPVSVVAQTRAAASTGTPTSTSTGTPTSAAPAAVTPDEAGSRAVTHLGGGTVTKVERETEHGRTVWEVDVRRDTRITEVHVDTATGAVTGVEQAGRDDRGRHGGDDRRDDHGDDRGGRHGSDDGPGHDRFDDKGGDR